MAFLPFSRFADIHKNRLMRCDVFLNARKWIVAQLGSVKVTVNECNCTGYHQHFQELDGHNAFCASRVAFMDDALHGFGFEHMNSAVCRQIFPSSDTYVKSSVSRSLFARS